MQAITNIIPMKYISCIILIVQTVSLILTLRYCRTLPPEEVFINSTAVFLGEVVKTVTCTLIVYYEAMNNNPKGDTSKHLEYIVDQVFGPASNFFKLAVPSVLYAIQNNLLFIALSYLPAAVYQITYQLKILTTAVFSVLILGTKLSLKKWIALCILTVGVVFVHLEGHSNSSGNKDSTTTISNSSHELTSEETATLVQNATIGIICVLIACVSSGFSGVYLESMLKGQSARSLWVRNIQLGLFGMIFAGGVCLGSDYQKIQKYGFWHGYSPLVYMIVLNHALGGLIVAMVMKYADNILKGFAASLSIIVCSITSMILFGTVISTQFIFGAILVLYSGYLYSQQDPTANNNNSNNNTNNNAAVASNNNSNNNLNSLTNRNKDLAIISKSKNTLSDGDDTDTNKEDDYTTILKERDLEMAK